MPKQSTIQQHRRSGKKLIPPLMDLNITPRSWIHDALPEMLWATLLTTQLKREDALSIFRNFAQNFGEYVIKNPTPSINVTHSGLASLNSRTMKDMIGLLCINPEAKNALRPLLFFKDLPGYEEWHEVIGMEPKEDDWQNLYDAINKTLFHQSQEATDCRWVKVLFMILSKRLMMPTHLESEIIGYPNVGDMRKVRSSIRASEIGLDIPSQATPPVWSPVFWQKSLELTKCYPTDNENKEGEPPNKEVLENIDKRFYELLSKFGESLITTKPEPRRESIFGIAFYAWRLTLECVVLRTSILVSGRLALRTLVECYIVLAYMIKQDDESLWSTYRSYGNGQAKLAQLKFNELGYPSFVSKEMIDVIANEDAWVEFVPIDLGNWGGLDLRKMSELSGTKSDYDTYYVWPSGFNHGNWGAIRETVLQVCGNPLHRMHRIPLLHDKFLPDFTPDALIVFEKVFNLVDQVYPDKKAAGKTHEIRKTKQASKQPRGK